MKRFLPYIYMFVGIGVGIVIRQFFGPKQQIMMHNAAGVEYVETFIDGDENGEKVWLPIPKEFITFDKLIAPYQHEFQFALTDEGKEIITTTRQEHLATEIIPNIRDNEYICAGYVYELSAALRGVRAPAFMGLQHPETRVACDAREMPYCYWYRGGEIAYDIGEKHGETLKKNTSQYTQIVTPEEMIRFFVAAFSRENILGDIGFLYYNTNYLHVVGTYGNYNSHIGKNMGLSEFSLMIQYPEQQASNELLIRNALGCSENMWNLLQPVRTRYAFTINGQPGRMDLDGTIYRQHEYGTRQPYDLQLLDTITYTDIALAHFFEGEKVDSLFQFSCSEQFYPINVINLNPKFIEQM